MAIFITTNSGKFLTDSNGKFFVLEEIVFAGAKARFIVLPRTTVFTALPQMVGFYDIAMEEQI
jgi:hypothetical protein